MAKRRNVWQELDEQNAPAQPAHDTGFYNLQDFGDALTYGDTARKEKIATLPRYHSRLEAATRTNPMDVRSGFVKTDDREMIVTPGSVSANFPSQAAGTATPKQPLDVRELREARGISGTMPAGQAGAIQPTGDPLDAYRRTQAEKEMGAISIAEAQAARRERMTGTYLKGRNPALYAVDWSKGRPQVRQKTQAEKIGDLESALVQANLAEQTGKAGQVRRVGDTGAEKMFRGGAVYPDDILQTMPLSEFKQEPEVALNYAAMTKKWQDNFLKALAEHGSQFQSIGDYGAFVRNIDGWSDAIGRFAENKAEDILRRTNPVLYKQLLQERTIQEANDKALLQGGARYYPELFDDAENPAHARWIFDSLPTQVQQSIAGDLRIPQYELNPLTGRPEVVQRKKTPDEIDAEQQQREQQTIARYNERVRGIFEEHYKDNPDYEFRMLPDGRNAIVDVYQRNRQKAADKLAEEQRAEAAREKAEAQKPIMPDDPMLDKYDLAGATVPVNPKTGEVLAVPGAQYYDAYFDTVYYGADGQPVSDRQFAASIKRIPKPNVADRRQWLDQIHIAVPGVKYPYKGAIVDASKIKAEAYLKATKGAYRYATKDGVFHDTTKLENIPAGALLLDEPPKYSEPRTVKQGGAFYVSGKFMTVDALKKQADSRVGFERGYVRFITPDGKVLRTDDASKIPEGALWIDEKPTSDESEAAKRKRERDASEKRAEKFLHR